MGKRGEAGAARTWLLGGLGLLLLLGAAVLLIAVGGLGGDDRGDGELGELEDELRDEELARREGRRPPPGSQYRGSMPTVGAGGNLSRAADNTSELSAHLRKGGKSEEELESKYTGPKMDVTIKGPDHPDHRFPDLHNTIKQEYRKKIADCYKQSLAKKPSLKGSLVLNLSLAPLKGERNVQVQASVDASSTISDVGLSSCVVRRVSRMRFDPVVYKEHKDTVFKYPLALSPGADPNAATSGATGEATGKEPAPGTEGQPPAPGKEGHPPEPGKEGHPPEPGKPGEPPHPEPGKPGEPPPKEPHKPGEPPPKEPHKPGEPGHEPGPPPGHPPEPGKPGEPPPFEPGHPQEPEPEPPHPEPEPPVPEERHEPEE